MPISEDSRAALALLKEVQQSVRDTEDLKNNAQVSPSHIINSEGRCPVFIYFQMREYKFLRSCY